MSEEVTMTSTGVWSLNTGHWSDNAVITVSNAPNIDPRARVISIRKKRNDQKLEPGILDKQILDIGSLFRCQLKVCYCISSICLTEHEQDFNCVLRIDLKLILNEQSYIENPFLDTTSG